MHNKKKIRPMGQGRMAHPRPLVTLGYAIVDIFLNDFLFVSMSTFAERI